MIGKIKNRARRGEWSGILRLRLVPRHVERHIQLVADDAAEILHIAGQIHALAVAEEEMALVIVVLDGVALNAVFQLHRIDDVDVGDEHDGIGARGDVLGGLHVVGFQNDVGLEIAALKEPVLNGADAVAFCHADEFFAHRVLDVDGLAILKAVRQLGGARGHQHDLLVFDEHIVEAVGLDGGGNQPQIALTFGGEPLEGVAAVFQQLDFDIGVALDELRDNQRQELDAALAGNAHAHAAVHLFLGFGDFRVEVAVDIQNGLRRLDVALPGVRQGDGIGGAVEDGRAQILLDELDRLRKRGLRDEQLFARRGDRALGQDGQHVVDMLKIQENPPAVDQSERCLKDNH